MYRVKLRCGDRSVLLVYTSMIDVLTAASDRLECRAEDVVLKIKIEGDEELWEIEGEAMLKSAVEEGSTIYAFSHATQAAKRSRMETSRRGVSASQQPSMTVASTKPRTPPASPSLRARKQSRQEVSQQRRASLSASGNESADEATARSSGRKWTEKDDKLLWTTLDSELKHLPLPNPSYSLEERKTVFEQVLQKHPRRFAGRTHIALQQRVQRRVLDQRKANRKLPARINALFPISRMRNKSNSSQPVDGNAAAKTPLPTVNTPTIHRPVSSIPKRARSVPPIPRRPYNGDVIRVQAVNARGRTQQEYESSSSDESSSDDESTESTSEEQEGQQARRVEGALETSVHNVAGGAPVVSSTHVYTSRARDPSDATPPSENHPTEELRTPPVKQEHDPSAGWDEPHESEANSDPSTDPGNSGVNTAASPSSLVKMDTDVALCVPRDDETPPAPVVLRAETVRAQVRTALNAVFPTLDPEKDYGQWSTPLARLLLETCVSSQFTSYDVSYCFYAAFDELIDHSYYGNRNAQSLRSLACSMGILIEGLYANLKQLNGLDMLLCRLFRSLLFEKRHRYASWVPMIVACSTFLLPLQRYDSVLDGIFAAPWSVQTQAGSRLAKLDAVQSEHVFERMSDLLSSLDVLINFIRSKPSLKLLALRRGGPIRFKANAWKRLFEETDVQSHNRWSDPRVFEHVRKGMTSWNFEIAKDADFGGNSGGVGRSTLTRQAHLQSPPAHNTRSNTVATTFHQDRQPLFFGLPDFSQQAP